MLAKSGSSIRVGRAQGQGQGQSPDPAFRSGTTSVKVKVKVKVSIGARKPDPILSDLDTDSHPVSYPVIRAMTGTVMHGAFPALAARLI